MLMRTVSPPLRASLFSSLRTATAPASPSWSRAIRQRLSFSLTVYQYSEPELSAAVKEAARLGKKVAVHATGEPGTLYAAQAGVVSIDHANQLGDETMRLMREKQIFAVPTFTIFEYFSDHAASPEQATRDGI